MISDAVTLALSVLALASGASSLILTVWSDRRVRRELHYSRLERHQNAMAIVRLSHELGDHTSKGDKHIWDGVQDDIDSDADEPFTG